MAPITARAFRTGKSSHWTADSSQKLSDWAARFMRGSFFASKPNLAALYRRRYLAADSRATGTFRQGRMA
jgi:hypothetical protein